MSPISIFSGSSFVMKMASSCNPGKPATKPPLSPATGVWELQEHIFETLVRPAVREIFWQDGGDDAEYWAGHYGTLLDGAELTFNDPAPTNLHLTPGTYPLNAPGGGHQWDPQHRRQPRCLPHLRPSSETQSSRRSSLSSPPGVFLDDGSDQGTAWSQPLFDDSVWASGSAELGYGEGDELSTIAGQGTHFTNYFRHRFILDAGELADISGLSLRLKRDDGAVVYLKTATKLSARIYPAASSPHIKHACLLGARRRPTVSHLQHRLQPARRGRERPRC